MAHTHPLLEAVLPRRRATLGDQIASLSHDIAALAGEARRLGEPRLKDAARTASSFAEDLVHTLEPLAQDLARSARATGRDAARRAKLAGRAVRDDPVPAVIALGTFALLASLLLRRQ